jgi:hypothetical protein
MEKVRAPLLLLQSGARAVFLGWEPYAALRYLKKPVDLTMLQPGTHVMTNPKQRLASETTNVDWLRFWLKEKIDPDPAKAAQYERWKKLKVLASASHRPLRDIRASAGAFGHPIPFRPLRSARKR